MVICVQRFNTTSLEDEYISFQFELSPNPFDIDYLY